MFKFKASDLPEILTRWSARYSVFVPSGSPDNAQMRIWSRRTRKEVRFMEPDEYTNLIVAPKGFVFGEREELFRWEGNEKTCTAISAPSSSSLQEEDKILFGLRPCDTYGLAYMDRFFLGEHHDINYHLRRQHVFIVAVNCLEAGPECYCASMGTGPFAEIREVVPIEIPRPRTRASIIEHPDYYKLRNRIIQFLSEKGASQAA